MNVLGMSVPGTRPTEIKGLKKLLCPEEGRHGKAYDDFKEAIERHITATWSCGADIGYVLKNGKDPTV